MTAQALGQRRRLDGRVIVVVGAGSGIGAATAVRCGTEGAIVAAVDVSAEAAIETTKQMEASGLRGQAFQCDARSREELASVLSVVRRDLGVPYGVHQCAGGSIDADTDAVHLSRAVIDEVLDRDLHTALAVAGSVLPSLVESRGSLVLMSSYVALRGAVNAHAYVAAKGAVSAVTRAMAGSYARQHVRVNAIAPGVAMTRRAAARLQHSNVGGQLSFEWDNYPFAQGSPEDIAAVAAFLLSDDSRMITGQTIAADGGLSAY